MGIFGFGDDTPDSEKSTEQLEHEAAQQEWRAKSKDPFNRADAHGRLDEIDEALANRDYYDN